MSRYSIKHRTTYQYVFPVTISHHLARLEPLSNKDQSCESFHIAITPECEDVESREDYFGNSTHMFSIPEMHKSFIVETNSVVNVHAKVHDLSLPMMTSAEARDYPVLNSSRELNGITEFSFETSTTSSFPELHEFTNGIIQDDLSVGLAILKMLDVFKDDFKFDSKATDIHTPIEEVLKSRRGVCQDFAHLMIAALRSYGLCARYVSGYILSHPAEGMPRLEGADASHAWVSVFIPHLGWVEVDPTNRLVCGDEHVRVAYGRDYDDVGMIKGAVTGGGKHSISVEVTMAPYEKEVFTTGGLVKLS